MIIIPLNQRQDFLHLHLDSFEKIPEVVKEALLERGFYQDDFDGAPEASGTSVPVEHLSKTYLPETKSAWAKDLLFLHSLIQLSEFSAYTEGEVIVEEVQFGDLPLQKKQEITFRPEFQELSAEQPFKEAELHLEMQVTSEPFLIEQLLDSGMMPIYWTDPDNPDHQEIIFTLQGDRQTIAEYKLMLKEYLLTTGGYKQCRLLHEVIPRDGFHYYGNISFKDLPAIAVAIKTRK